MPMWLQSLVDLLFHPIAEGLVMNLLIGALFLYGYFEVCRQEKRVAVEDAVEVGARASNTVDAAIRLRDPRVVR